MNATEVKRKHIVVGFGGSSHDFSSVISVDGDIRFAIEDERLSRRKHGEVWWYQNPIAKSLEYCLKASDVNFDEVDTFVSSDLLPARSAASVPSNKLRLFPHHLCHAASALLLRPCKAKRAGIIVYDGMGSTRSVKHGISTRETFSFFLHEDGVLRTLGETFGTSMYEDAGFPMGCSNSIGHFYELVTLALGFSSFEEGKTMGLAAYGRPKYLSLLQDFTSLGATYDACFSSNPIEEDLASAVEEALRAECYSFTAKANMAASVQALIEDVLFHCWRLIAQELPDCLLIAGGCGLNSVANGVLAKSLPDEIPLIIPPYPGDAGLGFGAINLFEAERSSPAPIITFRGAPISARIARPGKSYTQEEIDEAVRAAYPKVVIEREVTGPSDIGKKLAEGQIIALFRAGAEIGPRALGGRSLLADPRSTMLRERLNRQVKHREPFRPLAPLVLKERFNDYFCHPSQADPFMIKVADVRAEIISKIPAAVHADSTARAQTVDRKIDPFLADILKAFEELTGVPVLLNTSFNRQGEPIVESPDDAIDCFLGLNIDGLWLEDRFLSAAL